MEQLVCVTKTFEAAHQDLTRERCKRVHGHVWTVEIESQGGEDDLEAHLAAMVYEWQDRYLNEMVTVTPVSPERLAAWIMEVSILKHPRIVRVAVSDGHLTGIVRREIR